MDRLRELAARQHALVEWGQARSLGYSREALRHGIARGDWDCITRRVLGVNGAPPDELRRVMAAVLDAGAGAVAGRRTGAALWNVPGFPGDRSIELTRGRGRSSRITTLGRIYPVRYLPAHLVTTVRGIPVVSLPYLLYQLAGSERSDRVERAMSNVCTRSPAVLVRLHELLPELAEHGRNGIVLMREWLDQNPPGARVVASGLEGRLERILREGGERPLHRQVDVGGHEWIGRVDFADRDLAILFEVDSLLHHTCDLDVANDALRDEQLLAAGFQAVVRIPEEWIWYDPDQVLERVRRARRSARSRQTASGT